tara:strand:- start:1145 stop:1387 length:243 start_codon:yes stop_codon:yes gene_type:complete
MQQPEQEPADDMLCSYMHGFETGFAKRPLSDDGESKLTLQGYSDGLKLAAKKAAEELEDTRLLLQTAKETTAATGKATPP